jgi:hypothetical protein
MGQAKSLNKLAAIPQGVSVREFRRDVMGFVQLLKALML